MLPWKRHREYRNHHLDSTRWDGVPLRDDDIVITTSYKSGTTWTQWLVHSLVALEGSVAPDYPASSPWVDERIAGPVEEMAARLAAQTHRRYLKSHLPADGLPYQSAVRYVLVARDPRDVFMSLMNHWQRYTEGAYARLDASSPSPFPRWRDDPHGLWRDWITRGCFPWEQEGYPFWGNLHHTASYWPYRDLPNLLLLHYNDLQRDLSGQLARLARFLDIEATPADLQRIAASAHIDSMREAAQRNDADWSAAFQGGARGFFYKGSNGRWRDVLDDDDLALYADTTSRLLDPAALAWLENGWLGR